MSFKQTAMQPIRIDYACDLCGSAVLPNKDQPAVFWGGVESQRIPHTCSNPNCREPYTFTQFTGQVFFFPAGTTVHDDDIINMFTPQEDRV